MSSNDIPPARKYRSRKQKPCDNCRRRRVCCVRDAEGDCALCSRRSIPCTFSSEPSPRKRRARSTVAPGDEAGQNASDPPNGDRDSQRAVAPTRRAGAGGKYVGLSGTDDVYFVVDRFQPNGNDPAREAYFKVFLHTKNFVIRSALISSVRQRSAPHLPSRYRRAARIIVLAR